MKKRFLFQIVIFVFALFLFCACGKEPEHERESEKEFGFGDAAFDENFFEDDMPAGTTVLRVAVHDYLAYAIEYTVEAFMKEFPDVRVEVVEYSFMDNTLQSVMQLDAEEYDFGRVTPDLFFYQHRPDELLNKKNIGRLMDLYVLIENDDEIETDGFLSNLLEAYSYNGKLPLLPVNVQYASVSVNKNLFGYSRELLDFPEQNSTNIVNLIKLYNSVGLAEYALYEGINIYDSLIKTIASYVDYVNGTCSFDTPEFRYMAEYFKIFGWTTHFLSRQSPHLSQAFFGIVEKDEASSKEFVFVMSADITSPFLLDTRNTLNFTGLVPLTDLDGRINIDFHAVFGINGNTQIPEIAWEFVKFNLNPRMYSEHNLPVLAHMTQTYYPMYKYIAETYMGYRFEYVGESNLYLDPDMAGEYIDALLGLYAKLDKTPFYYNHFQDEFINRHVGIIMSALDRYMDKPEYVATRQNINIDQLVEKLDKEIKETFDDF
ncbi:MAG: hypothetical protein FWE82_03430 [Defluviitaleaceae bacterium]|nr:hypothetical protein [Defluviitaleaceae bacterium]